MRSRTAIIFGLVLASVLALFFVGREGPGKAPRGPCFTTQECLTAELCAVVPKADGFATAGVCGEACADGASCPNGHRCAAMVEADGFLVPIGAKGAKSPAVRRTVCVPADMKF